MNAPPCPNRQVPPFASNSSQGSKIAPTPSPAACILSVCRHFGQRISRNRQAEAKVFTIMSATHLLLTSKEAIHETNKKKRSF
jgi:hypothetical protein